MATGSAKHPDAHHFGVRRVVPRGGAPEVFESLACPLVMRPGAYVRHAYRPTIARTFGLHPAGQFATGLGPGVPCHVRENEIESVQLRGCGNQVNALHVQLNDHPRRALREIA